MTDDFRQRVEAAKGQTNSVAPTDAQQQLVRNPDAILIETLLRENVPLSEQTENVVFISVEELDEQAGDASKQKWDPRLLDPNRQIITT